MGAVRLPKILVLTIDDSLSAQRRHGAHGQGVGRGGRGGVPRRAQEPVRGGGPPLLRQRTPLGRRRDRGGGQPPRAGHGRVQPLPPPPVSPCFPVLARACLWCLGARMWRVSLPFVREKHTEFMFNTAHCASALPQASAPPCRPRNRTRSSASSACERGGSSSLLLGSRCVRVGVGADPSSKNSSIDQSRVFLILMTKKKSLELQKIPDRCFQTLKA